MCGRHSVVAGLPVESRQLQSLVGAAVSADLVSADGPPTSSSEKALREPSPPVSSRAPANEVTRGRPGTYQSAFCGYGYGMVRLTAVFVGVVALLVGILGLITPVSVSPYRQVVSCGSAIAPDLSEARSLDDTSAANVPVAGEVVVDTDYTQLCRMELEDRRLWTITVAVVGALAMSAAGIQRVLASRKTPAR